MSQNSVNPGGMNPGSKNSGAHNPFLAFARRAAFGWLNFWFGEMAPNTQWAFFRIATASLVYHVHYPLSQTFFSGNSCRIKITSSFDTVC